MTGIELTYARIAHNLARIMRQCDLSVKQLAIISGLWESQIRAILTGTLFAVDLKMIHQIADPLGYSIDEFFKPIKDFDIEVTMDGWKINLSPEQLLKIAKICEVIPES